MPFPWQAAPPRPLLVISIPRSGSSWVGEALGTTPGTLYLREPINQVHLATSEGTLIPIDPASPPPTYVDAAARVFARNPDFPEQDRIVQHPERWTRKARRSAPLVIKEVNPLALRWLLGAHDMGVILLVRHPAAVALSFRKMGWWDPAEEAPGSAATWFDYGKRQADVLHEALAALEGRPAPQIVRYEDLCMDPPRRLADLAAFAGLPWTPADRARAEERSQGGDRKDPYGTNRNSRALSAAWREEIERDQLASLLDGWSTRDLPWYGDDASRAQ